MSHRGAESGSDGGVGGWAAGGVEASAGDVPDVHGGTEADLEEGETFEGRLRGVVAAFNNAGFDDAEAGTAGLRQVTWATMVVTGEPEQHSMAATHFAFGAGDLRFIASLKVIPHTLASLA